MIRRILLSIINRWSDKELRLSLIQTRSESRVDRFASYQSHEYRKVWCAYTGMYIFMLLSGWWHTIYRGGFSDQRQWSVGGNSLSDQGPVEAVSKGLPGIKLMISASDSLYRDKNKRYELSAHTTLVTRVADAMTASWGFAEPRSDSRDITPGLSIWILAENFYIVLTSDGTYGDRRRNAVLF